MTTPSDPSILAEHARLELPEERRAEVGDLLATVADVMQKLETLDLAGVQPSLSFDARWE